MVKGLVAILMLKNENKYVYGPGDQKPEHTMLEQVLNHLHFCEHIIIADGMSDDGSDEVYKRYKNVKVFQQETPFNENNILNSLLDYARKYTDSKWVLYLDGDEILENLAILYIKKFIKFNDPAIKHTVRFGYMNLWRSRTKYRTDKFHDQLSGKFFSLHHDLKSFGSAYNNHHFAFGTIDNFGNIYNSKTYVVHYAWVDWNHIDKKYKQCVWMETELNKKDTTEAENICKVILDEEGIRLNTLSKFDIDGDV